MGSMANRLGGVRNVLRERMGAALCIGTGGRMEWGAVRVKGKELYRDGQSGGM